MKEQGFQTSLDPWLKPLRMESKRKGCGKNSTARIYCACKALPISASGAFSFYAGLLACASSLRRLLGFPMAFAVALRLQWRDRTGLEPVSLFAALLRNIESINL